MFGLRGTELLIILLVLLLLFGATRLPQLGSSLGSAIKNFKKGFQTGDEPPQDAQAPQGQKKDGPPLSAQNTVEGGAQDPKVQAPRES